MRNALSRTMGYFRTPQGPAPVDSTHISGMNSPQDDLEDDDDVPSQTISTITPVPMVAANGYTVPSVGALPHTGHLPPHRSNMKADQFSGQSDLLDYLQHFERVASWNRWSATDKAIQLAMALAGDARMVLTDLPSWVSSDYDQLVKALKQRFCPEGREVTYKAKFRRRTRHPGETVREFGYVLRRLAARAFPHIHSDAREEWVLDQFISGLTDQEERRHVQFGHPLTVEAAIALADEYEGFYTKPRKPVAAAVTKAPQSDTTDLQAVVNDLKKKVEALQRPNRQNRSRGSGRRVITCYNCREEGHISRECPKKEPSGGISQISEVSSQPPSPLN